MNLKAALHPQLMASSETAHAEKSLGCKYKIELADVSGEQHLLAGVLQLLPELLELIVAHIVI